MRAALQVVGRTAVRLTTGHKPPKSTYEPRSENELVVGES